MPYRHICFSFHMPLFFLLAGYFHHNGNTIDVCRKSAVRLLVPYCFTSFVMICHSMYKSILTNDLLEVPKEVCAAFFASGGTHSSLWLSEFRPIGAIWFLVALFWCKNIYNYIFVSDYKWKYMLVIVLSICATLVDRYLINLPFAILPGLSAMIFYMIGNFVKEHSIPLWVYLIALLAYPLSVVFCRIYMVQCYYSYYPLAVLGASGGTMLIYIISQSVKKLSFLAHFFSWLGRMSLVVLCTHMVEALCGFYKYSQLPNDLIIQVPVRIIGTLIIVYVLTKINFSRRIFQIQ